MPAVQEKSARLPFSTTPLSDVLGAEVVGFDVKTLQAADAAPMLDCLRDCQVLVFRDQNLPPDAMVRFLNLFGEAQRHPLKQFRMPDAPELYVISNIKDEQGNSLGNPYEGLSWHTDIGSQEKPTIYTVLYGVEVPVSGVRTRFASMYDAYTALPMERREALEKLKFIYSYETQYTKRIEMLETRGITDHQYGEPLSPEAAVHARRRVLTPIVDTNPYSGRKWLHFSTLGCAGVDGMSEEAGVRLVEELEAHAISQAFRYDHAWRRNDLVMWDNRGLLHSAGDYDRKNERRMVWRGSIAERV